MKQLDNSHIDLALSYLSEEPEFNLFLTGDIANCGMKSDLVRTYTADEWDENKEFPYFILDYNGNFLVYSKDPVYDAKTVAHFLSSQTMYNLSGKQNIIEQLCPYFPERRIQNTYMARLNKVDPAFSFSDIPVTKLGESDLEQIYELYMQIKEFAPTYSGRSKENIIEGIKYNVHYGYKKDGVLLAIAGLSASTETSAMLVGVATHPDFREQGYASAVVGKLCQNELESGKQFLCLFYDNPKAGRIYNRIGFKELGIYTMLRGQ